MNRLLIILILLFPIVSINGCEENELDKPTNIRLKVSMEELEMSEEKNLKAGKPMQIDNGRMAIESIEFDGTRENAKDYYFSKSFENGLIGDLGRNKFNLNVTLDIPQGVYHPAEITLNLEPVDTPHSLTLGGIYNMPAMEKTQLEFAFFENSESITLKVQNTNGNKKVLFKKEETKTLNIEVNLNQLFARFNLGSLNNANVIQEENTRKIIVSPDHNEELYDKLVDRIDKSMKAVLK